MGHRVCDGLVRFDGDRLDRCLPGRCIFMEVADDEGVWVDDWPYWRWALSDDHTWDVYVITPEAVTASE